MNPLPHRYEVQLTGGHAGYAMSEGIVDRQEKVTRFTEIVLRPRLTIPQGTDRDRAMWVLQKSEQSCLVSASLATPIRLEPEIVTAS